MRFPVNIFYLRGCCFTAHQTATLVVTFGEEYTSGVSLRIVAEKGSFE